MFSWLGLPLAGHGKDGLTDNGEAGTVGNTITTDWYKNMIAPSP